MYTIIIWLYFQWLHYTIQDTEKPLFPERWQRHHQPKPEFSDKFKKAPTATLYQNLKFETHRIILSSTCKDK